MFLTICCVRAKYLSIKQISDFTIVVHGSQDKIQTAYDGLWILLEVVTFLFHPFHHILSLVDVSLDTLF